MTNVAMDINITDAEGNPANGEFFVSSPTYSGAFSVVNGIATLPDDSTGTISFTFIPDDSAAANGPTQYMIGGTIGFTDPCWRGRLDSGLPVHHYRRSTGRAPAQLLLAVRRDRPGSLLVASPAQRAGRPRIAGDQRRRRHGEQSINHHGSTANRPEREGLARYLPDHRNPGRQSAGDAVAHRRLRRYRARANGRRDFLARIFSRGHLRRLHRHVQPLRCPGRH